MDSRWRIEQGKYYFEDNVIARSHIGVDSNLDGIDYTSCTVFAEHVTLKPTPKPPQHDWSRPLRRKLALSTDKFCKLLAEYDEQGFNDMPKWMKDEFLMRVTYIKPRQPTELEQWETNSDALEHRIVHKELTIEDYHTRFVKGKQLSTHGVFNNV